jgi:hypothetical protein
LLFLWFLYRLSNFRWFTFWIFLGNNKSSSRLQSSGIIAYNIKSDANYRFAVFIAFAVLEVITVLLYFAYEALLPFFYKTFFLNTYVYRVEKVSGSPNLYRYRICCCLPFFTSEFRYSGDTNKDGKPHGRGEWVDTSPLGELRRVRLVSRYFLPYRECG